MRNEQNRKEIQAGHRSLILEQVSEQWQANDRAAAFRALPWSEQLYRRRRYTLNVLFTIVVIATVIFAAAAAGVSAVTYEERIAQTADDAGLGGLDRAFEEIKTEAMLAFGFVALLMELEIYYDLKYFLLVDENERHPVKTAVNKTCGVLVALSVLLWLIPWLFLLAPVCGRWFGLSEVLYV